MKALFIISALLLSSIATFVSPAVETQKIKVPIVDTSSARNKRRKGL